MSQKMTIFPVLFVFFSLENTLIKCGKLSPLYIRTDGADYPVSLVGPGTHGPYPQSVTETTLTLNGESYNLREAVGPLISGREKKGDLFGDFSASDADLFADDTTPAPVQGAIDYVLLPLIILAISGPIFVIIFIVMASVEFKLTPNVQLREERSLNNRKHTYFDLYAVYNGGVKPLYNMLSRTLEQEQCQERAVCWAGEKTQPLRKMSPQFFQYTENFLEFLVPHKFLKIFGIYTAAAKEQLDCSNFSCS